MVTPSPLTPRHLTEAVRRALENTRVVNLVGPRQAGKTRLVRDLLRSSTYLTMDDDLLRSSMESDPYGQLDQVAAQAREKKLPVIIDEVQRVPGIALALKRIVDEHNQPGQFLLTGSSDIFTTGRALDSLAGRTSRLTLYPFSSAEIKGAAPCMLLNAVYQHRDKVFASLPAAEPSGRPEAIEHMVRGGYPEIRQLNGASRMRRYKDYLDTIIERDVAEISHIRKPYIMRRLLNQLAYRTAEELTIANICGELGTNRHTLNEYLDILTQLNIVMRLPAWKSAPTGRDIKSPKCHFLDTGCATALRGEDMNSYGLDANPTALGHILETFVVSELLKSLPFQEQQWELYHWRNKEQREVDILAEAPGRILALFEMKASTSVTSGDFKHLRWFLSEGPGSAYKGCGFVVYLGDRVATMGDGMVALPLSMFWSYKADSTPEDDSSVQENQSSSFIGPKV